MTDVKLAPYDLEAEEAVNGSLLVDGPVYKDIAGILAPTDFLSDTNKLIFAAASALYKRGVSIDLITLRQELEMAGAFDKIGGVPYLNHLLTATPTALDVRYYADIVKRLSIFRQLITAGEAIAEIGMAVKPDVAQPLDEADAMLLAIRKKASYTPIVTPHMRAEMMESRYTALFNATNNVAVKTSFGRLDRNFGGGFYNGELIIFAGRPGIGKTTLLQQMANHQGKYGNVLFCSAEMPISSVTDRDIASALGVHIHEVRQGKYSEQMYSDLLGALGKLSESNVYYLESKRGARLTTSRVMSAAVEMQARYGLTAIFVDYLGIMADEYGKNANERLGYISRQLKAIAMDLDVPLITAHQLSRAVTQREGNEPQLSDLYECVTGGTLIQTTRGMRPIYDIYKKEDAELLSITLPSGEPKIETPKVIDTGSKWCLKIKTKGGRSIELSRNTPVYVDGKWVKAKDIKIGDKITCVSASYVV
jgi:replicative DNA helicase